MCICDFVNQHTALGGYMKGSITIEAALIYPIIIVFSVFIILYSFYAHDRLSIKANAYTSLIKTRYELCDSPDTSALDSSLQNTCLLTGKYSSSYDRDNKTLSVTDNNNMTLTVSFKHYERCEFVRRYSCLFKIIKGKD